MIILDIHWCDLVVIDTARILHFWYLLCSTCYYWQFINVVVCEEGMYALYYYSYCVLILCNDFGVYVQYYS